MNKLVVGLLSGIVGAAAGSAVTYVVMKRKMVKMTEKCTQDLNEMGKYVQEFDRRMREYAPSDQFEEEKPVESIPSDQNEALNYTKMYNSEENPVKNAYMDALKEIKSGDIPSEESLDYLEMVSCEVIEEDDKDTLEAEGYEIIGVAAYLSTVDKEQLYLEQPQNVPITNPSQCFGKDFLEKIYDYVDEYDYVNLVNHKLKVVYEVELHCDEEMR
jgi:hypothetical protein